MSFIHRVLQRLLGAVARMVCAAPGIIVTIGGLLAAASLIVILLRANIINNTNDLLSESYAPKRAYTELKNDFGSDYRYIILIQSPDVNLNRKAADEIGQYLETLKPQITTVLSKINFDSVKPRLLFTQTPEQLEKIAKQLTEQRDAQNQQQVKDKNVQQTALDLNSILSETNQKFNDPTYLHKKENWKDFTPFVKQFVSLLDKVSAQAEGKTLKDEVPEKSDQEDSDSSDANEMIAQHEYFSLQDGKSVLVFAYTGEPDKNGDTPFSETTAKIRDHLKEIQSKYPGATLELTGEPALDTDQIAESGSDATKASLITIGLIVALFFFSYRSFLRPTFALLVLIMAVLWSLAFTFLTVGHLNILSVAVIPMVLGIGIDFGIQILGRYEEELRNGRSLSDAVNQALQHTGVAIITGGSTTAAAFFTLCFNDFVGLAELGVIAGCSMVFCIVAALVVLPAMFLLRDRSRDAATLKASSADAAWKFIRTWDHDMVRNPWLWIVASILVSIAAAVSLPRLRFDYNLLNVNNPNAASMKVLFKVMDASKDNAGSEISTIYASVVADNIDQARELSAKLLALPRCGQGGIDSRPGSGRTGQEAAYHQTHRRSRVGTQRQAGHQCAGRYSQGPA